MRVLVGAAPIAVVDRQRLVQRFPGVTFDFAEDAAAMAAAVPEAEIIFTKGIPGEALAEPPACAGCRPARPASTACCAWDWGRARTSC